MTVVYYMFFFFSLLFSSGSHHSSLIQKDPSHFASSAGGRLHLNTHAPYVYGLE